MDGIVVEGGLSSCVEIAAKLFSFLPVRALMKDKWAGTCAAAAALRPEQPFMSMHTATATRSCRSGAGAGCTSPCAAARCGRSSRRGHNNLMEKPGYFEALDEFYEQYVKA